MQLLDKDLSLFVSQKSSANISGMHCRHSFLTVFANVFWLHFIREPKQWNLKEANPHQSSFTCISMYSLPPLLQISMQLILPGCEERGLHNASGLKELKKQGEAQAFEFQGLKVPGYFQVNYTNGWRLKQQTNGNAITANGQKPMLDNLVLFDTSWQNSFHARLRHALIYGQGIGYSLLISTSSKLQSNFQTLSFKTFVQGIADILEIKTAEIPFINQYYDNA